ncbi:hypothetical protein CC86DRAFT_413108 [Ophiobolus disseminans]|uniref:Uncharacterized protein n=1 Tax=Ophiobolus disseminans TaxID=1469910 RepID=A0A6A6ZFD7_9PLEO|nr:hypothetical protein CC86DRAFT_413108 [Ophiobolus disseminans]
MSHPNAPADVANSVASIENMQEYRTKVGCSIFGKHNVWWFQLEKDSNDGPDWGIIDVPTQKPRIKDLSCPGFAEPSPPAELAISSQSLPTSVAPISIPQPSQPAPGTSQSASPKPRHEQSTTHVTTTSMVTMAPSPPQKSQRTVHVTTAIMVTVRPTLSPEIPLPLEGEDEEDVNVTLALTKYVKPSPSLLVEEAGADVLEALPANATPAPKPSNVLCQHVRRRVEEEVG